MLDLFISLRDGLIHYRDMFNDHVIFGVGILLIAGFFIGKLAEKIHLPAITGYIFTGLVLGDSITGIIHTEMLESCFGAHAASYPTPEAWAERAVPHLLSLGPEHHGRALTTP